MIYLDSCILIYALEDGSDRGEAVRSRLALAGHRAVAISPLVALECTVGPLAEHDLALHDKYMVAFGRFRMLEPTLAVHLRAADLRARHRLPTPDALHLAFAQLHDCDELWTNDARLTAASGGRAINVVA